MPYRFAIAARSSDVGAVDVPIVLANDVMLTAGTILYWPATRPSELRTLATGLSGAPGSTIATLDTKTSSFFDHRDPEIVKALGQRKLDI